MRKLRATEVCSTAASRVIAIEALHCRRLPAPFCWLQAAIEPVAIVVSSGDGNRVIDFTANPVSLETLMRDVPGLAAMLGSEPAASVNGEFSE